MWWEDDLTACVARRGLTERMTLIQGNRNDAGGEKAAHLLRHLSELDVSAASVVMIGDSLDDAAAAGVVGTACVLYDGGSHHRTHLEDAGVPVTDTLAAAVFVAAQLER
jgi:phosphoglycolate phosphatase-like HAD superfamily hydrolase